MRRWWHVVVLGLLFGCVANVGVAWWCHARAWTKNKVSEHQFLENNPPREFVEAVPMEWIEELRADPRWKCEYLSWEGIGFYAEQFQVARREPRAGRRLNRQRAGWPWRAFRLEVESTDEGVEYRSSLLIPALIGKSPTRVPIGVIGAGFIANSAFFGAVGVGFFFASKWVIRRRRERGRVKRGECAGCGYSRVGMDPDAACPECGRENSSRRVRAL